MIEQTKFYCNNELIDCYETPISKITMELFSVGVYAVILYHWEDLLLDSE
jgi:hypothetical protein